MVASGSSTEIRARLRRAAGLARSLAIYHGNPLRRIQSRRHYAAFVKPGDLCFDIGAHLGDRVRAFTQLGARVVALEPQPHVMALLRRFYGRHPAVTLIEAAVGAEAGQATLHVSQATPSSRPYPRSGAARSPPPRALPAPAGRTGCRSG